MRSPSYEEVFFTWEHIRVQQHFRSVLQKINLHLTFSPGFWLLFRCKEFQSFHFMDSSAQDQEFAMLFILVETRISSYIAFQKICTGFLHFSFEFLMNSADCHSGTKTVRCSRQAGAVKTGKTCQRNLVGAFYRKG